MIELTDWIRSTEFPPKPWLVVGKGPTFTRIGEFDLGAYNVMSLNHVVREMEVDVAHAIDIDVITACADELIENCRWLVMPRRPHSKMAPGPLLLEDYIERVPALRQLDSEGRLVWYNLVLRGSGGREWNFEDSEATGEGPPISVRYFSSEAAISVLAAMGTKQIRSIGVDGGSGYSSTFRDLENQTMLANSQPSFDLQFEEIKTIVEHNNIDYAPLVEPIRVFAGCDESQIVAAQVLEYSIRRFTSRPVEFNAMLDLPMPTPKDKANRPRTGFSFYRFAIPKLCGYKGRALYIDADMQVFSDMAELWDIDFGPHKALCTYQSEPPPAWKDSSWFHPGRQMSVMMLDCSRLDWDVENIVKDLDDGKYNYRDLMFDLCLLKPEEIGDSLPAEWNSLENYEEGKTKLLHYTVVETQPWKNDQSPLKDVWTAAYIDALKAGAATPEAVEKGIRGGHLKDSLAEYLSLVPGGAGAAAAKRAAGLSSRMMRRARTAVLGNKILRSGWRSVSRLRGRVR